MSNRIVLIGDGRHKELVAAAAITPGHLIEVTSAGKFQVHSTEGGYAERCFATEDALQGNTISDAYSTGDQVMGYLALPGDEIYAWLKAGEDIDIGDELISDGDGTLIENGSEASGTTVKQVVAIATEALDLSGSGAVTTRLKVRVL